MFLSLQEYLLGARKMLYLYGIKYHINDEDSISYVADAMMNADATWDGKSSSRNTWRFNQAKYAILHLKAKYRRRKRLVSLEMPIGRSGKKQLHLKDIISNKNPDTNANMIFSEFMDYARNILTEREFECISLYYLDSMTEQQIGDKLGITKQAISLNIKKAIKKLKNERKPKSNYTSHRSTHSR